MSNPNTIMRDETIPEAWHTFAEAPPALFDVVCRYYDAGLNKFLIQRFTNCFMQDGVLVWPSPFVGSESAIDLQKAGYRAVLWMDAPEVPSAYRELLNGPADHD